ncbi:uncharacterized protein LOC111400868 isoform X2 [Olea europaea var. sylvestris]|uniref:uncharacterized protein LOC111400868 isoform X2 n=1 Tax=Olea europaea var. sylvestris TaxID=158386 RepID=UPI000C1D7DDB|nr:uncharacterized protein LOC111400868 isoform X2 [Olea europaea var. sylvestris]
MMDLIARRYLVMVNDNDGKRVLSDAWALDTAQKTICGRGLILKVIDLMQVCTKIKQLHLSLQFIVVGAKLLSCLLQGEAASFTDRYGLAISLPLATTTLLNKQIQYRYSDGVGSY